MRRPEPSLEWQITNRCNYNCSYCCQEEFVKNKGHHCSEESMDAVFRLLEELPGSWLIKLIGGEPLIHPDFINICRNIVQTRHRLCMTTNFSSPLPKLERILEITGNTLDFLTASLHLDQVPDVGQFIDKASAFKAKKHPDTIFCVTFVCVEENFDALKEVADRFERQGIPFYFTWQRSKGRFLDYTSTVEQSISDKLMPNINKIKNHSLFGTICHSGQLFFRIDVNGTVRRCYNTQPLFYLGNINKGSFRPLKQAQPCLARKCSCTVPANKGMILFGKKAGKMEMANAFYESLIRLPGTVAHLGRKVLSKFR